MAGPKASKTDQQAIETIWPELVSQYEALQLLLEQGYSRYVLYGLLSRTIYQMAVLHEINDNLKTIQLNKNIVPLAEFNKRIAQVIMREPAPFVYERLGERFHHYLIDEFQDTSVCNGKICFHWLTILWGVVFITLWLAMVSNLFTVGVGERSCNL